MSVNRVVLLMLKAWQKTRAFRPAQCRFYPSCSQYLHDAIVKHGLVSGSMLGAVRLGKCHPFHPGGVDEVPDTLADPLTGVFRRNRWKAHPGDTTN